MKQYAFDDRDGTALLIIDGELVAWGDDVLDELADKAIWLAIGAIQKMAGVDHDDFAAHFFGSDVTLDFQDLLARYLKIAVTRRAMKAPCGAQWGDL